MHRAPTVLVATLIAGGLLAGCGGDSPYCAAVKQHQAALDSFGKAATDAAFAKEARAVRAIARTKPDKVAADWDAIDKAMRGVQATQKKTGLTFADLADADKLAAAEPDDVEAVNKAYTIFNETARQRMAVVGDLESTCDVTLK